MKIMVCLLMVILCVGVVLGGQDQKAAPWDAQMGEMLYALLRTSSINLIHGLNLTLEQADALHALASETARTCQPLRVGQDEGLSDSRLALTKSTYEELQAMLLDHVEVTEDMEKRVVEARTAESEAIRASLVMNPRGKSCNRCHADPGLRGLQRVPDGTQYSATMKYFGHIEGAYGKTGAVTLWRTASKVDGLLNDAQRAMVREFSCCLIPPKALSDPARVGQADVSEKKLELLQSVRKVPDALWPIVRGSLLKKVSDSVLAKTPGIADEARQAQVKRLGEILDRTRKMDEVAYEMEKHTLVASMEDAPAVMKDEHQAFYAASFLLLPGNAEVYERLIARIKAGEAADLPQVDLQTIQGAQNCEDGGCALENGGNL